jgi:hypothetical protein
MDYNYEGRVGFDGDAAEVLERVRERLAARKFNASLTTANELQFENALPYPLLKTDPLYVVSRGCVTATKSSLTMRAELRYLRETTKYTLILFAVTVIPMTTLMAVTVSVMAKQAGPLLICAPLLAAAVLLVLSLQRLQRRGTSRALDALLREAAGEKGTTVRAEGKEHGDGI